jgi:PAS domain S-box-containing protein
MKIRTQFIAGIVVFAILLAIIFGLVLITNQQVEKLFDQETMAQGIALEVGELGYLSNDYILYREPQQADRWNTKYASISARIARLSVDQPEQQAIVRNLAANLKNSKSVFDDIAGSPLQSGATGTGFVQLSWSRMAVQNQGMIFDAGRLANLLHDESEALKQQRNILIFSLMGAFVVFLLVSYLAFYRSTLRSLASLQQGAAIVGSGDFIHSIDESSDDEIGDLARSFNRMTADLRNITASKSELEREVDERKRAEEDLQTKNEELNAINEELTALQEELHQNIEELTKAEQEVRSSREQYRNLFETMAEGFAVHEILCDDQGTPVDYRFLSLNPAFEKLTGLKERDVIGKRATEVLPGIEPFWIRIYGKVALSGKPAHFENYSQELDRHYEVDAYSPEPGKFATLFLDITERKRGEQALKESEERYRLVADFTYDWEFWVDPLGNLRYVSPGAERILGRPVKQGSSLEELLCQVVHPDDKEKRLRHLEQEKTGTGRPFEMEYRIIRQDGATRWIHHVCQPIYDAQGNFLGTRGSNRDITDRKLAEEELIRKNDDLNALNEELTATQEELHQNVDELIRREHDLNRALAEKEVLLSEIHHRVKNNLTAFISLLSLEGSTEDTPAGKLLKQDLQNRARSMALIHETLYRTNMYDEVDMGLYLTTLVHQIATTFRTAKEVKIMVDAHGVMLDINRATPAGLIINELVTNSFKYAFPGSFDTVAARSAPPAIMINLTKNDKEYVLTVSDNGIGLPPGFDLTKTKTLGLKLVNFLAKHQMRATVEVLANKGTEFIFRMNK